MLVVVSLIGGPLGLRKRMNKIFRYLGMKPRKRIKVHCWISGAILAIGVIHGILLVRGPFSGLGLRAWGLHLWLGWLAALLFGLLGIHGLYQKKYIKWRNYKEWMLVHQVLTVAALLVVIIHGVLVGTDFQIG